MMETNRGHHGTQSVAMPILSGGGEGSEERHLGDSSCILKMTKCSSCRLGWGELNHKLHIFHQN